MNNIIEIENLHFSYKNDYDENAPAKEVLKGIDLKIKKGECIFLAFTFFIPYISSPSGELRGYFSKSSFKNASSSSSSPFSNSSFSSMVSSSSISNRSATVSLSSSIKTKE